MLFFSIYNIIRRVFCDFIRFIGFLLDANANCQSSSALPKSFVMRAGDVVATIYLLSCLTSVSADFLVNVKTDAGNVVKQSIRENISESSVILEYEDWDLTQVTQVVDFKSSLNIFRIIIYGEIELGQPPAQILCFIGHFATTDFIEPDAVSKLRQVHLFYHGN